MPDFRSENDEEKKLYELFSLPPLLAPAILLMMPISNHYSITAECDKSNFPNTNECVQAVWWSTQRPFYLHRQGVMLVSLFGIPEKAYVSLTHLRRKYCVIFVACFFLLLFVIYYVYAHVYQIRVVCWRMEMQNR